MPLEAGDEQGTGVARFTSVQLVRERTTDALADLTDPFVIVGGDCGVSAAGIADAGSRLMSTFSATRAAYSRI